MVSEAIVDSLIIVGKVINPTSVSLPVAVSANEEENIDKAETMSVWLAVSDTKDVKLAIE